MVLSPSVSHWGRWLAPIVLVLMMVSGPAFGLAAPSAVSSPVSTPLSHPATAVPVAPTASNNTNAGITVCGPGNDPTLTATTGVIPVAGNFTVCNNAIVTVKNARVEIESQTATNNFRLSDDLAYRFHVNVSNGAQLRLVNASINTTAGVSFGSYPKLNLTISNDSSVSVENGSLAFAGWIYVTGGPSGGSDLYLNHSAIRPNWVLPVGTSNYTQDNAFAPQLTVDGGSNVITEDSSIQGLYSDAQSLTNTLNENFVSTDVQNQHFAVPGTVKGFTVPDTQALTQDTYPTWSEAKLSGVINATVNGTLVPTFKYNGHVFTGKTVNVAKGNSTNFTVIVPGPSFVTPYMNPGGLTGLLNSMQAGTTNVTFAGTGAGTLSAVAISMVPLFGFNVTFAAGSHLYAVDSSFDVNYANSTCVAPSSSNKMYFLGGSGADLLNSSSYITWVNQTVPSCGEMDAFLVDASSTYWVYNWAVLTALGTAGSPSPGAVVSAVSAVNNTTIANLATTATDPKLFNGFFSGAVDSVAAPQNPSSYGITQANGVALYALATAYVSLGSLPDGLYVGGLYHITFNGSATFLNGTTFPVATGSANSPPLCGWPRISSGCGRTVLAPVSLALSTADVQISQVTLSTTGMPSCTANCNVFEGDVVSVSVNVTDVGKLIVADHQAIPVYVYDVYGTTNVTLGELFFSFVIGSADVQTQSISWTIPYAQSGTHMIQAIVDPLHVAPENGTVAKINSMNYNVYKSPQILVTQATITIVDSCSGQTISLARANTCNRVNVVGTATNTGDAGVTATFTLTWNGTFPIGTTKSLFVPAGGSASVNGTLLITTQTFTGMIQLHVETPVLQPVTYPRVYFNYTQSETFEDYTTLVLNNPSQNFSLGSIGSDGSPYTVAAGSYRNTSGIFNLTAAEVAADPNYSPFGVGTGIQVSAIMQNLGGSTTNANATLYLVNGSSDVAVSNLTIGAVGYAPSTVQVLMPMWHINPAIIGQNLGLRTFVLTVRWSNDYIYGVENFNFTYSFNVFIRPPVVYLTPAVFTYTKIDLTAQSVPPITIQTTVNIAGPYHAVWTVYYEDVKDGYNCSVTKMPSVSNGSSPLPSFQVPLACLQPGTYSLVLKFTVLGNVSWIHQASLQNVIQAYVPQVASQGFIQQYWLWLVIAAAAIVAVALVFFFFRRLGRGNLVECGECGELIPESAVACPKCGAEFEKELMRCSRCGASIPSDSSVCPDCSALLVGMKADPMAADYNAFTQRFRVIAQKELAENYNEGAFWDWWKRQPTYVPFATWKQQMAVSGAAGGAAPAAAAAKMKGRKGQGGSPPPQGMSPQPAPPAQRMQSPPQGPAHGQMQGPPPEAQSAAPGGPAEPGMKACPSCGRNINDSMLLCPFCSAVTR